MIYKCALCDREEDEDKGSWNEDPYLFFCSEECHRHWLVYYCIVELDEWGVPHEL